MEARARCITPLWGPSQRSGDINGDGFRDIVVTCAENNTLMIYLGSKDGSFRIATRHVQTGRAGLAIADLQGRGRGDIVVSNNVLENEPQPPTGSVTILSSR